MARYIDADKLKERLLAISVVSDDLYGMGINRGLDRAETAIDMMPTADVVPKSEVDNWYQLYHSIKEELKQEKIYHRETEKLCDRYCIESQQAKKQVAREIFEEIEKYLIASDVLPDCCRLADMNKIAELKKKYIGEKENEM